MSVVLALYRLFRGDIRELNVFVCAFALQKRTKMYSSEVHHNALFPVKT